MTCRENRSLDEVLRQVFDVVLAATALVLLSPLIVVICAAILAESGRPVIFAQTRLGQNGRTFRILKFRKFGTSAGTSGLPLTMRDDARLSGVGRYLALSKLDELPQLINVLRGEMSIVGPRPESLDLADCFTAPTSPVLRYRPGIFGPAQVAFRNEAEKYPPDADPVHFYRTVLFPMKARIDLAYYGRRTLMGDIRWIVLGILVTLGVRGAIERAVSKSVHISSAG